MNEGTDSSSSATKPSPKSGEALVFSEENYQGRTLLITADRSSLEEDFPAASLQVGTGTGVTVYAERDYGGACQEICSDLGSFAGSRLQDKRPHSLKIWQTGGKPFNGYWAIEVTQGQYLSVCADAAGVGILTTSPRVTEREAFRVAEGAAEGPGRRKAEISVRGAPFVQSGPAKTGPLTIDDLQSLTLVDEQEKGYRKFSLLTPDLKWISYQPELGSFVKALDAGERTIFCRSIKIAEHESQVGELLPGEAALYENIAYWGKAWVFHTDYANFENVPDLNNQVSSIQLGPRTGATIYRAALFQDDDPRAGKQDVTSNIPSLAEEQVGENEISSIDLWQVVPPESMGVTFTCCLSQDFRKTGATPEGHPTGQTNRTKLEEYSAYRTILRLPPTVESVEIWATDTTDIEVDDQIYHVEENRSVTLQPNAMQRLMITTDAMVSSAQGPARGSLKAPGLKIRTNTMLPDERIVIFPDRSVHERLASLGTDELWKATYKDKNGTLHYVVPDRNPAKQADVASAQKMITNVMATVKCSETKHGSWEQTVSADELQGKAWKLDFPTYQVTGGTVYARDYHNTRSRPVGILRKGDLVEAVQFNREYTWIRVRRLSDNLTGWSSARYLERTDELPAVGEKYRVTSSRLHVREGPGIQFPSLGFMTTNEAVSGFGINEDGTWRQIRRSDGLVGWCAARYLTRVVPFAGEIAGKQYQVTGTLYVREGAGAGFAVLGVLQSGETVKALEANESGTWLRVRRAADGLTGWVARRYLVYVPHPSLPAPGPAPAGSDMPQTAPVQVGAAAPSAPTQAPNVQFHEISQEEVQALLALAESAEVELAQGILGSIFSAVKSAVSFVVTPIKNSVLLIVDCIVDGVRRLVRLVADTVSKVIEFVEGIIEKIGATIEEIIKWLRILFEWGDILHTRNFLRTTINNTLDYMGKTLQQKARDPVRNFFKDKRQIITGACDSLIEQLGGDADNEESPVGNVVSAITSAGSEILDWILSKIMGAGMKALSFVMDLLGVDDPGYALEKEGQEKLRAFWEGTLTKGAGRVFRVPLDLSHVLVTVVKHPDQPLRAVAELVKMFRRFVDGLLEIGEDIVLGLIDLMTYLVDSIKRMFSTDIRIPFLSDLLEWIGLSGSLGFSLLDAATLILAIPVTAISKAKLDRAPFQNVPALALGTDEWAITAGVAGYLGGLVAMPLDATPEEEGGLGPLGNALEVISLVFALASLTATWGPGLAGKPSTEVEDEKDALWWVLLIYEAIIIVLDLGSFVYGLTKSTKQVERFKRTNQATIIAATGMGVIHLILLIVKGADDHRKAEEVLVDSLTLLPELGSVLRLKAHPLLSAAFLVLDGIAAETSLCVGLAS